MWLEISAVVLQLVLAAAIVIFLWDQSRKSDQGQTHPVAELELPPLLFELEARLEKMERSWNGFLEDADDRIDRGNKAWRRVRAAQRREEESGEDEEWGVEVPGGDAPGGDAQGMLALPAGVEGELDPLEAWTRKKRMVDRMLAGID